MSHRRYKVSRQNNSNDSDKASFSPISFLFMIVCAFLAVRSISPTAATNMDEYFSPGEYRPAVPAQPKECRPLEGGGTICN